jgi:hypothetical protein
MSVPECTLTHWLTKLGRIPLDDDVPIWNEPLWMEGLNDLGQVLEGITNAPDSA